MGDVFRAYHVGGLQEWPTQVVGSGQSITHTNTPKLGGVPGDVAFGITNTNSVYCYNGSFSHFSSASVVDTSGYINADSLTVGVSEYFDWFRLMSSVSGYISLRIYNNAGVMSVGWLLVDDNGTFDSIAYANLPSGNFHFRVLAYRSTDADSNDGSAYLYLNGSLALSKTGRDFYGSFLALNRLYLGAIGIDAGTSGTLYMGKLLIKNDDADPGFLDPNEIVHLWMPPGNQLTQWTGSVVGSGQAINYDTSAALGGIPGDMAVVIANQNNAYKQVSGLDLSATTTVRIRCYLDSSQLTMAADGLFTLLTLRIPSVTHRFGCAYGSTSGQHYLLFRKMEDGGALRVDNNVNISAGVHYIEMLLQKASSSIAGDGKAIYYLDGVEVARWENIDIYDDFVALSELRVGASADISPLDVGTSGTFYLGKLQIRDDNTEIGALPLNLQRLLTLHRLTDLTVTLG